MTGRTEADCEHVAAPEFQPFGELETEEGILRSGPEAVAGKPDESASVARDELGDAFGEEGEAQRVAGAENIADEMVAVLFRTDAETERFGTFDEFSMCERMQLVDPQVARS